MLFIHDKYAQSTPLKPPQLQSAMFAWYMRPRPQTVWNHSGLEMVKALRCVTGNDADVSATRAPIWSGGLARPVDRIGIGAGRASMRRIPTRTALCSDPKHLFRLPTWFLSDFCEFSHSAAFGCGVTRPESDSCVSLKPAEVRYSGVDLHGTVTAPTLLHNGRHCHSAQASHPRRLPSDESEQRQNNQFRRRTMRNTR